MCQQKRSGAPGSLVYGVLGNLVASAGGRGGVADVFVPRGSVVSPLLSGRQVAGKTNPCCSLPCTQWRAGGPKGGRH